MKSMLVSLFVSLCEALDSIANEPTVRAILPSEMSDS